MGCKGKLLGGFSERHRFQIKETDMQAGSIEGVSPSALSSSFEHERDA